MGLFWSSAASGLCLSIAGLAIGAPMTSQLNRPNLFRSGIGELIFGCSGFVMMIALPFFLFRLFWDNGWSGLLQLLVVVVMAGLLARTQFLRSSGVTPVAFAVLDVWLAYKVW